MLSLSNFNELLHEMCQRYQYHMNFSVNRKGLEETKPIIQWYNVVYLKMVQIWNMTSFHSKTLRISLLLHRINCQYHAHIWFMEWKNNVWQVQLMTFHQYIYVSIRTKNETLQTNSMVLIIKKSCRYSLLPNCCNIYRVISLHTNNCFKAPPHSWYQSLDFILRNPLPFCMQSSRQFVESLDRWVCPSNTMA